LKQLKNIDIKKISNKRKNHFLYGQPISAHIIVFRAKMEKPQKFAPKKFAKYTKMIYRNTQLLKLYCPEVWIIISEYFMKIILEPQMIYRKTE